MQAGLCPGHHESAGRVRSTRVRPGNPYLKGALGMAAFGAARTKDSFLQARYKRLTARRGPIKALVAVEHSIITAIWHMLNDNVPYHELGGDYFTQRDPERAARRAVSRLNELGYRVTHRPDGRCWMNERGRSLAETTPTGPIPLPERAPTCSYLRVRVKLSVPLTRTLFFCTPKATASAVPLCMDREGRVHLR